MGRHHNHLGKIPSFIPQYVVDIASDRTHKQSNVDVNECERSNSKELPELNEEEEDTSPIGKDKFLSDSHEDVALKDIVTSFSLEELISVVQTKAT